MKMPIPRRPDKEAMRVEWSRAIIFLGNVRDDLPLAAARVDGKEEQ